jgi:hypothetical protein
MPKRIVYSLFDVFELIAKDCKTSVENVQIYKDMVLSIGNNFKGDDLELGDIVFEVKKEDL